jgi:hypothetical protein
MHPHIANIGTCINWGYGRQFNKNDGEKCVIVGGF